MAAKFRCEMGLTVLFIKENSKYIAYAPALDLSTCGNTPDRAKKRFEKILNIFIKELIKMGTLEKVLSECGWQKISRPHTPPRWIPPSIIRQEQIPINV